jgi:pilus assembly protein CpaF
VHDHLERLAGDLRDRLLATAGEDPDGAAPADRVRALVDARAGALGEAARSRVAARVLELSVGLGPLEPLLADPDVE